MHTACFAACVCPALPVGGVFFAEGRKNNLEFKEKNAIRQSVDELTAKLQFVSYQDSLL